MVFAYQRGAAIISLKLEIRKGWAYACAYSHVLNAKSYLVDEILLTQGNFLDCANGQVQASLAFSTLQHKYEANHLFSLLPPSLLLSLSLSPSFSLSFPLSFSLSLSIYIYIHYHNKNTTLILIARSSY